MFVKMCADLHCSDSDLVLFVDSDCVFIRPFNTSEMFENGKPMVLRRPWQDAETGIKWRIPAEKALGFATTYDTMVTHPSIYWTNTIKATRDHIEAIHNMPLEDYVRGQDRFIEFVILGNFALAKGGHRYSPIDCVRPGNGLHDKYPRPLSQFYSWGGMTPKIISEIEEMLR